MATWKTLSLCKSSLIRYLFARDFHKLSSPMIYDLESGKIEHTLSFMSHFLTHSSKNKFKITKWILYALGIILFPSDALAWGPVAHIDFSLQILAGSAIVAPAVLEFIRCFSHDFIYGCLAADSIVGKNLASDKDHCHSWTVARDLLAQAEKEGQQRHAFMLGYLSHLAEDVIAHNHFVPHRVVTYYQAKGLGHLYWEARFDKRLLRENPALQDTWNDISERRFPEHDSFLAKRIKPTVFSNFMSTKIYRGSLKVQRHKPWQETLEHIDTQSKIPLGGREISRWRAVSTSLAAQVLNDSSCASLEHLDPTGRLSLKSALAHRRLLRRRYRRRHSEPAAHPILERNRSAFASIIPPRTYFTNHTS